jgi:hypothetical protein
MDEAAIHQYILETFEGVSVTDLSGDMFFFYDPERKFPFVTLVTSDAHDKASDLGRSGVFRLNIGVKPESYQERFGPQPAFPKDGGIVQTGHDFTALDQIMPHPVYAAMSWVCVLNPASTLTSVKALLAEAYALDVAKHSKRLTQG